MKVIVLMSTYNGKKYLREQLDSILSQDNVDVEILVRDDGSSDGTEQILDEYQKKRKLTWYSGKNLKPAKSFLDLMKKAKKCDYYAFADQDDFWEPEKLENALKKFSKDCSKKPQIYFSNKKIVDEKLNIISDDSGKEYNLSFGATLVRNIATGCTMVFNRKMLEIINEYEPDYISMHDAWMYRVCQALGGDVFFDKNAYILYRQHSSQAIGAEGGVISKIKRRVKSFFYCEHSREKTALELLNGYKRQISDDNLEIIELISNVRKKFKDRVSLARDKRFKTESREKNFVFKVAVMLGKI